MQRSGLGQWEAGLVQRVVLSTFTIRLTLGSILFNAFINNMNNRPGGFLCQPTDDIPLEQWPICWWAEPLFRGILRCCGNELTEASWDKCNFSAPGTEKLQGKSRGWELFDFFADKGLGSSLTKSWTWLSSTQSQQWRLISSQSHIIKTAASRSREVIIIPCWALMDYI